MNIKTRKVAHVPIELHRILFVAVTCGWTGSQLADYLNKREEVIVDKKNLVYTEEYARKLMQRFRDMVGIKKT